MTQSERDRQIYELAKKFLRGLNGVTQKMLDLHLALPESERCVSMPAIYERVLISAQTPTMKPSVIGNSIGGVANLKPVLCGFVPKAVVKTYGTDWERLLDAIVAKLHPRGKVRREPRSLWPRFCATALSGAEFLSQFSDGDDFHAWARTFNDIRSKAALPMLLDREIDGFGFAVACDFLKEIGYSDYGKPDVHLQDIFTALGVCRSRDNYEVFKAIVRMAVEVGQTPFHVDKLFWLIGSGKFHYSNVNVGGHKKEFIEYARSQRI